MKNKTIHHLLICLLTFLCTSAFAQNVGINELLPLGMLHIKGSENISQLVIDADTNQINTSPLIKLRSSLGTDLLWINSDDSTNTFMGFKAGLSNVLNFQGLNNTFIGSHAGYSNTNGRDNTVIGINAFHSNTRGSMNTVIGSDALFTQSFLTGSAWYQTRNVAIGYESLYFNQPSNGNNGNNNTAVGTGSMRLNTTGSNNTANGIDALYSNTTGSRNTAVGAQAGVISAGLTNATAIGSFAKVDTSNALVLGGTGSNAVHVGIGTQKPQAKLDIYGDVIFRSADLVVADGVTLTLDVNTEKFSYYRLTGPTSQFELAGITAGISGRLVTLFNVSGFPMQLNNADVNAAIENRIITGSNENLLLENLGMVSLRYDGTEQKWIVNNTNRSATAGIWETSGSNIFFDNYVGIGTDEPSAPLSIETEVGEVGFSHTSSAGSTNLSSYITTIGAAIGTTSQDVLSLNAGGEGKVHIWPDGRVVIGDDADPNNIAGVDPVSRMTPTVAKLTLETPINSTGFMHIGGADEIIVREAIGGVAASIGTETNHTFRLITNAQGRLHVQPDGRVVIGTNFQPPAGQFTVFTPNNTNGIVQVGGDNQLLAMRIGGSSASIGTWTPHIMRIVANGVGVINIDPAGNIGIGTPDPLPGYKVAINGSVKAKELVIETVGWPDYVFAKDYKSLSLPEVEKFIKQHHHLPNIPSAKELEEGGVAVGEMQKKMMEKIEELTLYIIELNKEIQLLKQSDK